VVVGINLGGPADYSCQVTAEQLADGSMVIHDVKYLKPGGST
jgi:hypothetical protein